MKPSEVVLVRPESQEISIDQIPKVMKKHQMQYLGKNKRKFDVRILPLFAKLIAMQYWVSSLLLLFVSRLLIYDQSGKVCDKIR